MKVNSDIRKMTLNIRKIKNETNFANFANVNVPLPLQKRIAVAMKKEND